MSEAVRTVVLISANTEWRVLTPYFPEALINESPLGEWFVVSLVIHGRSEPVLFFHGGWGKIAAAASTQYVIDRWQPEFLINLGTCGGFEGEIERGAVVLVERTLVYDIIEQMGGAEEAIAHYATQIDLTWLPDELPHKVKRTLLVSADRDLVPGEIDLLKERFHAVAGDWESGAIAWTAARNQVRLLILRGVSDLVSNRGGEAYDGAKLVFTQRAAEVLAGLVTALPEWLELGLAKIGDIESRHPN